MIYGKNTIKIFVLIVVLVIVGNLFILSRTKPITDGFYPETIHVAMIEFPGYQALYVARDKGFFEQEGLDVVLDVYPSYTELDKIFALETTHARTNLSFDLVESSRNKIDQKVILIMDNSAGADAIIGKKEIESVSDLKGKRIALDQDSFQMAFLSHVLIQNRLSLDDVQIVSSSTAENSLLLIQQGEADGALVFEPSLSEALGDSSLHQIASSAEYPDTIFDVLAFKPDFIEKYPNSVAAFTRAYFKARQFIKDDPTESAEILAREFGQEPADVLHQLSKLVLYDVKLNKEAFHSEYSDKSFFIHLYKQKRFFLRKHDYNLFVNTDILVDPTFIRALPGFPDTGL